MTNKTQSVGTNGVYRITITCHQNKPLIQITAGFDFVYKWFDYLGGYGHCIAGYIIMPDHIDAIIGFRNTGSTISGIVAEGKRMIGSDILGRLRDSRELEVLGSIAMEMSFEGSFRCDGSELWQDSFLWKHCRSNSFIDQQLDAMHRKPGSRRWNLARDDWDYTHSSAAFYQLGFSSSYPVFDYRQLGSIDLSRLNFQHWW